MGDTFKLRRGLKKVYVAEVLTDDAAGYTTGATKHLIPAGTMTRAANGSTTNIYFDDVVFAASGTEGATTISITGASLRAAALAWLGGKDIDEATGMVMDSGEYAEKYFAIGGEAEGLDGSSEWFWFHKCSFTPATLEDLTKNDTTDANGMTLEFNAIQTTHVFAGSGKVSKFSQIDSTVTAIKTGKSWTAQVVTPDNKGDIIQKIIPTTGLNVTPASATIAVDGTTTLAATLTPAGATGVVTWATTDATVATVDSAGVVTGVSAGSANIIAVSGGFSAAAAITVTE